VSIDEMGNDNVRGVKCAVGDQLTQVMNDATMIEELRTATGWIRDPARR
jgi:hypothetical protein